MTTTPTTATFGERLAAAVREHGPLCVGIDPHPSLLQGWGLVDDAASLERFAFGTVEALAGRVAVVKPQSAFFERHGSRGVAVLERTLAAARDAGLLTLLDVKRGDIGTTARAYADAYLDPSSPLAADAITVSPYLGLGSLEPFWDAAAAHGRGVFVLALTSNPEGPQVQHARSGDTPVAQLVLDDLRARNAGSTSLGSAGAVVGATIGPTIAGVDVDLSIRGPLLVPGLGAQGATGADVDRVFAGVDALVLPSTSRAVLAAGPDPAALRDAAARALR